MPLFLTEHDIDALVDMPTIIATLEEAFLAESSGEMFNLPRHRFNRGAARLNVMLAGDTANSRHAVRAYGSVGSSVSHIFLYGREGLLAVMEARLLSGLRTGAASAVATKRLAGPDASMVGLIGAGVQAETQLTAIAAVRPVREVLAHARNRQNLDAFCTKMSGVLNIPVRPTLSPRDVAQHADIIITATNSVEPVLFAEWLKPGVHINAMGANAATRKELETKIIADAACIVTDDLAQAHIEAGEFLELERAGGFDWKRVMSLSQLVAAPPPRETGGVTVFKSLGTAIEDLASASFAYDEALRRGIGKTA